MISRAWEVIVPFNLPQAKCTRSEKTKVENGGERVLETNNYVSTPKYEKPTICKAQGSLLDVQMICFLNRVYRHQINDHTSTELESMGCSMRGKDEVMRQSTTGFLSEINSLRRPLRK